MAEHPKYREIADVLLREISAGQYAPSRRLPSEAQLVKRFDVSRPTVARALRELQDKGLVERRVGSGTFVRSRVASVQSEQKLGLLVPDLSCTEIFEVICGDLARLARVHDYSLLWGISRSEEGLRDAIGRLRERPEDDLEVSDAEQICAYYIEREVSGVFFAPVENADGKDELNHRLADRLRQAGIAVVLLDRDIEPFPNRSELDLVGVDNFACGYVLAEHLLKLNCQHLTFLAPPFETSTVESRISGVAEAMRRRGISRPDPFVLRQPADSPELLETLQSDMPDAVVCYNDRCAASLMQALTRVGLDVPRDIRVVGFDDVNYATLLSVPLTTIRQPCREIAAVAFRAMLDSIKGEPTPPRQYVVNGELVVRESCGAYLPTSR